MIIDGLRPARDGVTPLPVAAPSADELGELLRAHGQRLASRR
jgi:hypothetical protein